MSFAVLRIAKIKTAGGAGGLSAHIERTMDVPNADAELKRYNQRLIGSGDLWKDIQDKLSKNDITEVRKNGVYALEFLMTASPEHFNLRKDFNEKGEAILNGNPQTWHEFITQSMKWLEQGFGKGNIVNFTTHLDEQTPHIHAVVVPLVDSGKTKLVKNSEIVQKLLKKEYSERPIKKLSAKSLIDGRDKLRALQDSFAEIHRDSGLKRGLEGSKAKHTTVKDFYASIQNNPTLEAETLKLVNQRSMKKETLTEERLKVLENTLANSFGHRPEWEHGKATGKLINLEEEKVEKERKEKEAQEQKEKQTSPKSKSHGSGRRF